MSELSRLKEKKFRPGWDSGFFMERTLKDREVTPRLKATRLDLPEHIEFDGERILAAWAAIGVKNDLEWIKKICGRSSYGNKKKPTRKACPTCGAKHSAKISCLRAWLQELRGEK
jgi:hypothetical protein